VLRGKTRCVRATILLFELCGASIPTQDGNSA
jgi:hypothetical protein